MPENEQGNWGMDSFIGFQTLPYGGRVVSFLTKEFLKYLLWKLLEYEVQLDFLPLPFEPLGQNWP